MGVHGHSGDKLRGVSFPTLPLELYRLSPGPSLAKNITIDLPTTETEARAGVEAVAGRCWSASPAKLDESDARDITHSSRKTV